MHRRKKEILEKKIRINFLHLCTKFQCPGSNNKTFFFISSGMVAFGQLVLLTIQLL